MNRVNKFFILFLFFAATIIFGGWQIIQSPYFAKIVSNHINKQFISKLDAEVELGNLEFTMFPPSTHLRSISARKYDQFEMVFEQLSLKFSFWDIFRSNLHISELVAQNGYISVAKSKVAAEAKDINLFEIINDQVLKSLPVNVLGISVINSDIRYGDDVVRIDKVNLKPYKSSIDLEVNLSEIDNYGIKLDEVTSRIEILPGKVRLIEVNGKRNTTKVFVNGDLELKKDIRLDLNIDYQGRIEEFLDEQNKKKYSLEGECHCKLDIEGRLSNPRAIISGEISDLESAFVNVEDAKFKASYKKDTINLEKLNIWTNGGSASLKESVLVNTRTNDVSQISVNINKLQLHDSLHFLGENFKIINGRVVGDINASITDEGIRIFTDEALVEKFVLDTELKLLDIEKLILKDLDFIIDENVNLKSVALINDNILNIEGVITSKNLEIKATSKSFNLSKIGGQIGGLVNGVGSIEFLAKGPLDNVVLSLGSSDLNDFRVLGYIAEQLTSVQVDYLINTNILNINDVKSFGDGAWVGKGLVDFDKNILDITIDIEKTYLGKLGRILDPIWSDIKTYVEPFDGVVDGVVSIGGDFDQPTVDIKVKGDKVSYFSEPFSQFQTRVLVDNEAVRIEGLSGQKGDGNFSFDFGYNYKSGVENTSIVVDKVKLGDLNIYRRLSLGYDAVIEAGFDLVKKRGYQAQGKLKLQRSSIGRKAVRPSNVNFSLKNNELNLEMSLLGGNALLDTKTYIGKRSSELSTVAGSIDIDNLRTLLGIVSLHNIYDGQLDGELKGQFSSSYRLKNYQDININFDLEKFSLSKYNKFIRLVRPGKFKVDDSKIEEMQIDIKGSGGFFSLRGDGDIDKQFKIEQNFELDLIYAQLLVPLIERVAGRVFGRGLLSGSISDLNNYHDINLKEFFVKFRNIPVAISHGRARSILNNRKWNLNNFTAKIGDGIVTTEGKVDLKVPLPEIELSIDLDNVDIPIKDNSSINLDSNLKLYGAKLPYLLEGAIVANGGRIEDEFTAFTDNSGFVKSVDKYIDISHRGLPETVALDVSFKTVDSIRIKNRLSDIFFVGDMAISGNPLAPEVRGQLSVIPTISKFKFKGNEFLVRDGTIVFEGNSSSTPLALSFSSEARVNDYDVKMSVAGGVEDLQINLESNPALSKEDIFSLLTLGVTSDFSKNLEAKDRESLTRIGLGTLIVDQLKINEGLDSTLGLKLSVLPEVSESDDSPIQTSKAEQQSKVKTATKLKIQKRITDKVGLTFSNTFGGEDGQKQEMNVDFNINDTISIQGVFEKEEETQDDGENGSIGADIKYKWSF